MKTIPIKAGSITIAQALVDDDVFDFAVAFCWRLINNYAYTQIEPEHKIVFLHNLAVGVPLIGFETDHKNQNKLDNQRHNLRIVPCGVNRQNCKIKSTNTSGFRGVRFHPKNQKFMAQIGYKKNYHHLGSFKTAEEAARAYDKAALLLYGPEAAINFPRKNV